ncbi:hypothetical protein [Shimia sp.]|uniref:hypothetical protein n=1 Tax=Shimia sp. TaxID=1954381 RepID=UPI003297C2D9
MREQIRVTVALDYDADADASPAEQIAEVLTDINRLADADSESRVEMLGGRIVAHESEAQIYSGEARPAFVKGAFHWFEIARVGEWPDYCTPIGWQTGFCGIGPAPDSVFWTVYGCTAGRGAEAIGDYKTRAVAVLMAERLADGRAVETLDAMTPGFRVTWETVTEESAEAGDAEARGFIHPATGRRDLLEVPARPAARASDYSAPLRASLEALEVERPLAVLEALEADSSVPETARSVSATWRTYDGETIAETRTLHFPETMTPASRARLVALICN